MIVLLLVFCEGAASSADEDEEDDADINTAAGAEEAVVVLAPGDATERSNGDTANPASRSQCDVMSLPVKFEPAALPSSVSHSWRLEWGRGGVALGVSPSNLNVLCLVSQSQREDVSHQESAHQI